MTIKEHVSILPHSHFPLLILIHLTYENIPSSMDPLNLTLSLPNKVFFYFIILLCTIFYFLGFSMKTPANQVYGPTDLDVMRQISS